MSKIQELFFAAILKKDSLVNINKYKTKIVLLLFFVTNIVFPFVWNFTYLSIKKTISTENVFDLLYFIIWNVIINLLLFLSLWVIFFITKHMNRELFLKAIVFMNLLQPLEIILSYTVNNFLITLFFIVYDIVFVIKYIQVNKPDSDLSEKLTSLYVFAAFLVVFIFLCIIDNDYMLFSEKIF